MESEKHWQSYYLKPETVARMIKSCIENEDGCVHDIVIRPFIEDIMP